MITRFKIGDEVVCIANHYKKIAYGSRLIVVDVRANGSLTFYGKHGTRYDSRHFVLAPARERDNKPEYQNDHSDTNEKTPNIAIYIAVEISDYGNLKAVANQIHTGNINSLNIKSSTSGVEIKEWVRKNLLENPSNKWVILHGNTLGQMIAEPHFSTI